MADKQKKDPSLSEIREILRETAKAQRELTRKQAETEKLIENVSRERAQKQAKTDEQIKETGQQIKETGQQIKETGQQMKERMQETDRQLKETDKQIKRLGRQIGGLHNRWGKIIESLLAGDLITIISKFMQVRVHHLSTNVKGQHQGQSWEIDILAVNEGIVTPTEVKTTLSKGDIDQFLSRILCRFTELMPEHKDKKVYGIIAFVKVNGREQEVIDYAQHKGLMIIKAMSGTNKVINPEGFVFHNFHPDH